MARIILYMQIIFQIPNFIKYKMLLQLLKKNYCIHGDQDFMVD
jgi:hypothetical protein